MITSFKNRIQSKNGVASHSIENSSKENKNLNSQQRPLHQFLYANRGLLVKINSNGKPGMLSPNPSHLNKQVQSRQMIKETIQAKSKAKLDIKQSQKISNEKKLLGLKSTTKGSKTQMEMTKLDEYLISRNMKKTSEINMHKNTNKVVSNQLVPNLQFSISANQSVPHFYNNLYYQGNLDQKLLNPPKDQIKSTDLSNQGNSVNTNHVGLEAHQFHISENQFSQTGGFTYKAKTKTSGTQKVTNSYGRNSNKMQIETEEDTNININPEYPKIPNFCIIYVSKIMSYLFEKESKQIKPKTQSMNLFLTTKLRVSLYDGFFGISKSLKLRDRTLFLSLELIEVYLSANLVKKDSLKMMGVSAMFMAAKYEEIYPPKMSSFLRSIGNSATKEELLDFEGRFLDFFKFDMTRVITYDFFIMFANVAEFDSTKLSFGLFVMCLCSLEQSFYACSHSLVAFGICYFLQKLFKLNSFYEIYYEDGSALYTLNISRGRFDSSILSQNHLLKYHESFKINFRHKDVKSVSEGIYTMTQKFNQDDCPNIFQKFQEDKMCGLGFEKDKGRI